MASYTAAQTRGSGSLGQEIPDTGLTFHITNSLNSQGNFPVGYLTLEGNATANQNLSTDAAMTGSFSNIVGGISEKSIVTSQTKWSISVFGSGGSFDFTPDTTIAANSYYIKGVGPFTLDMESPGPPPPPVYNNQFSFEFVEGRVLEPVFTSPDNSAFDIVDEFTISAWVRPGEKDPPADEAIIDKSTGTIGSSAGNGWSLYHDNNSTGLMSFDLKNGGTRSRLQVTNIPAADVWYHVAVTYKSSTAKMFINSVERDSLVTPFPTLGTNSNPVVVGAGSPGGTANYTGSLQNIAVFDVEFNQDEINELYNGGSPDDLNEHSRISDGIAWWQFGGNGDSGSFDGTNWTELNCFNNAQYVMTSANMIEADRIPDTP
jgi:hypothetical protein